MNNCQKPQQAASGNILIEVFEHKEVLRFHFSDVGESGLSAYELSVANGFNGTLDEWLESLVGPPVPVAQELGDDPELAVSQKLLKDSIDAMESSNESMVREAERLNSLSQQASESAGRSATNAELAKQAAELFASQAASSESNAAQSAQDSEQSALSASSSAAQSTQSAIESKSSADQAKNSSGESAASAQESLESAQAAKLSEQNALASEQAAGLSAQAAAESESNAKTSEQKAASSAQQSADSAVESAAQAVLASEYGLAAKGYSEQAGVDANRSEAAADRAEEAATLVEDKLDKSSVKDELGDSKEFVINQSKVTEMFKLFAGWLDLPKADAYADFENNRYFKDGMPCRFEDIFGFERLSEATTFDSDGLEIWGVDEPRVVRGKGLLVEPEQTQLLTARDWVPTPMATTSSLATTITEGSVITGVDGGAGREEWRVSKGIGGNDEKQSAAFIIDLGNSNVRYISVSTWPGGFPSGHTHVNSYDLYEKKWAKEVNHIPKIEVDNIGSVYFVRFTTASATKSYDNVIVWLGNDGDDPLDHSKWTTLGAGQQVKLMYPQRTVSETTLLSLIPSQDTPATRLADILTLPSGYTVSGDFDEGINVEGTQVSGFGYIRKLILEKK